MRRHFAYLSYVLRHKWFVLVAGLRVGASLWLLLIHDISKFSRREWGAYARQFFNADGTRRVVRRPDGGYAQDEAFRRAWLSHQRNPHHWQAWISIGDRGSLDTLPMPPRYVREMVADWMGAGRAITGQWEAREWYAKNRDLMILHPDSRALAESILVGAPSEEVDHHA